jgi:hypothetical protein
VVELNAVIKSNWVKPTRPSEIAEIVESSSKKKRRAAAAAAAAAAANQLNIHTNGISTKTGVVVVVVPSCSGSKTSSVGTLMDSYAMERLD